uniref:Ig-like domain-containing protein n=1 Tax=Hucho hucho TaxID=62062 RepID=A0A4W5QWD1_9TELE
MRNWLILHVLAACCFGCRAGENVIQPTEDVMVVEGQPTTLTCLFDTTDQSPYLFWYKQQANGKPMFMLRRDKFGVKETATEFKDRFDALLNFTAKSVPLTIQRVQLSDSAVYYCALKPTVTTGIQPPYKKYRFHTCP